jgi:hypothetical protein
VILLPPAPGPGAEPVAGATRGGGADGSPPVIVKVADTAGAAGAALSNVGATGAGKVVFSAKPGIVMYNETQQMLLGADVCVTAQGAIRIVIHPNNTVPNASNTTRMPGP